MKKIVVASRQHIASMNILEALGDIHETKICDSSIVDLFELKDEKRMMIVASPHSSKAGIKSFSVHTTGNFSRAEVGGLDHTLSVAPALFLGEGLRKFKEVRDNMKLPYEVTLEVTHHGPSFDAPMIYVEIGSNEEGWRDKRSAKAASKVITHLLDFDPKEKKSEIGIGGPHYAPNFTRWTHDGRNFGHICPKYATKNLDEDLLIQMIEKTLPNPEALTLDWKGIPSTEKERIMELAEKIGIPTQKVR